MRLVSPLSQDKCYDLFLKCQHGLARAQELAKQKGLEPIQIALAYVLHQPFPTFSLVGCRSVEELESSVKALEVSLNAEEVRWLEGG
jgi:aryl-alcohol dehydrogenase-like predicted oxidoreductase